MMVVVMMLKVIYDDGVDDNDVNDYDNGWDELSNNDGSGDVVK